MFELLGQRLWAIAPTAVEQLFLETRHSPAFAGNSFAESVFRHPPAPDRTPYDTIHGVAVVNVRGVLSKRGGWRTLGYEHIRTAVQTALEDRSVRAILLDIDSPGGSADGVKVLADWLCSVRGQKPMCAYADGTMMSAAYWLGAATGRVYAPVSAEVGSIGVVVQHLDWSGFNARTGVNVTYVHAGKWKVVGNPDNPLSEDDMACLQAQCDTLYSMFASDVSASMGLDASAPEQWADGQTFFAEKAQELGLVNAIVAGRDEVIDLLTQESSPMTRKELEDQHPELFAQVRQEGREEAEAQGHKETFAEAAALVRAVAGDDTAARFQALADAGISAKQIEALAPLLGASTPPETAEAPKEQATRQEILKALHETSPSPVTALGQPQPETPESKRTASVERMKQMARR